MLSERLFKQVKIKFCPATFQSPPISPSPFAITGLAPFRCWHAYCVSEVYLCIYNLYALSASAGWQLPSLMHLAYRSTQPPTFFPPSAPPPLPAITICWQCTQLLQAIVLCVCTDTEAILHCCIFSNNKIFSAISINLLSPRFREGCAAMVH